MRSFVIAAVLMLFVAVPTARAQETVPVAKWAILVAIDSTDTKASVSTTLRGMASRVAGRDPVVPGEPDSYSDLVLASVDPAIQVEIIVAVSGDVSPSVSDEIAALPQVNLETLWYGKSVTRDEMHTRLVLEAGNQSASRYWLLDPGADTAGFITSKFIDVSIAP